VCQLTAGEGADYTFEVMGLPKTAQQALPCTRRGGKAVIVGMLRHGEQLTIDEEINTAFEALEHGAVARSIMRY
jgi:Zn-dependent alcohol dehydrogenase